jgi:hypothetical protein
MGTKDMKPIPLKIGFYIFNYQHLFVNFWRTESNIQSAGELCYDFRLILHEIVMSQNIYKFSIVFGGYIKKKMEELNSPQCARRAIVMVKQRWQWSVIGWVIKTL